MVKLLSKMSIVKRITFGFIFVGIMFLSVTFFLAAHYIPYKEDNQTIEYFIVAAVAVTGVVFIAMTSFTVIKSINTNLREMVSDLSKTTKDVSQSSQSLSEISNSLSQGNYEQVASIEETSAAMNETLAMITQTAEDANKAVDLSKDSEKAVASGVERIEDLINFMELLNKSSDEINKIISTINSIASQTTILALNAAVEAVRAGEAGKSFTVVAEEVRNLAQQSTEASKSTASIIKENIHLIQQGVENFKSLETSLRGITGDSHKITQLIDGIATAAREQNNGVRQISVAMTEIEKVTQSTASIAEESSESANMLKLQTDMLQQVTDRIKSLLGSFQRT